MDGVAHWIECQPANQRVTGSIPSQGICLGCGPGPQQGTSQRQPHINVSLFSLPCPLKIFKKINIQVGPRATVMEVPFTQ